MGNYKISSQKFYMILKKVESFRSFKEQSKKVRCVETGAVFKNARAVAK